MDFLGLLKDMLTILALSAILSLVSFPIILFSTFSYSLFEKRFENWPKAAIMLLTTFLSFLVVGMILYAYLKFRGVLG